MSIPLLLLLNFALAAYLTGLIWTVQVVHYPSFGRVPKEAWAAFHADHTRRMGYVVMAPMVLELGLAAWLAWAGRATLPAGAGWWSLALVGLAWASTFFISVPFHNRLAAGYDYVVIDGLTRTNWLRTLAWPGRRGPRCWAGYWCRARRARRNPSAAPAPDSARPPLLLAA